MKMPSPHHWITREFPRTVALSAQGFFEVLCDEITSEMQCDTIHVKDHSPSHYKTSVKIIQFKTIHGVCICMYVCILYVYIYIYVMKYYSVIKKKTKIMSFEKNNNNVICNNLDGP